MSEREQLEQAIIALEAQRAILGDGVVEATVRSIREKLASLAGVPSGKRQRKQVTVLFADVPGFTAMSEMMDAEEVNEVMNVLWQRLDTIIAEYNGRVDKHMGDGVMALWGTAVTREDDAEQAIRAALLMQLEASRWYHQLSQQFGHMGHNGDLGLRIGINTGPVVLAEVGTTAEFTAIGDTVNVASRLEAAAPVGGVLIAENSFLHVRNLFKVQQLAPIKVKGKSEPLSAYLVLSSRPQSFHTTTRGVEGVATRMIGREAEMAQLQALLDKTIAEGQCHVVTIAADAGVGKSRLLYEFQQWLMRERSPLLTFTGRARLETKNLPYALFRDLFAMQFNIQESDAVHVVRRKMEQGIGEVLGWEQAQGMAHEGAHFIGQLIGFDFRHSEVLAGVWEDTRQIRDRALVYLTDYFAEAAVAGPVVLFMEDVHWADNGSLDVIVHLHQAIVKRPLFIVCLTRPILFEKRPLWYEAQPHHLRLSLTPLSLGDSGHLVDEILQKALIVPPDLRELIASRAEGNPFYLEEIVKMLIQDGVIVKGSPYWQIRPEQLNQTRIPTTLTGVLQAALDRLHPEELMILQQASVVGRTFWDGVLTRINQHVHEEVNEDKVQNTLSALRGREMIFLQQTSAFSRTQELIFKHALLREVTYETVLRKMRRTYHALVAEWLIERSGDRLDEYVGLIAEHLEFAGEREQAITYLRRAGVQAAAQFANEEAVLYLTRALALSPAADEQYLLLKTREKVYELQGNREAQLADLQALKMLVTAPVNGKRVPQRWQAEVALRWANYAGLVNDYGGAIESAQEAIALARATADKQSEAAGHLRWGWALRRQWQNEAAKQQLLTALELARDAQLPQIEADCLRSLGVVASKEADGLAARLYYTQALHLYQAVGDRRGEGHTLSGLGSLANKAGDYLRAQAYYERDLEICRQIGDKAGEGWALWWLGSLAQRQGDHVAARFSYERSLAVRRRIGVPSDIAFTLSRLGSVLAEQADFVQAQLCYKEAYEVYHVAKDVSGLSWVTWWLSNTALAQGQYDRAWAYADEALHLRQKLQERSSEGYAWLLKGRILQAVGLYEQAKLCFAEAEMIFEALTQARGQSYVLTARALCAHQMGLDEKAYGLVRRALLIHTDLVSPVFRAQTALVLGHALAGLGELTQAQEAYQRAFTVWAERQQFYRATEALAGLARLAVAQADVARGMQHIAPILTHLMAHSLAGCEEPLRVYLTCYHVLQLQEDGRATPLLQQAYELLQRRRMHMKEGVWREAYVTAVGAHEALVNIYQQDR